MIAGLARQIGVPIENLESSVLNFNEEAERACDPLFRRGELWFNNAGHGEVPPDARQLVAPVKEVPFYGMRLYDCVAGTFGGIATTQQAQVRHRRGGVVDGLYAVGNAAVNPFAPRYPAGGTSLGPGLVFGYLAALHACTS